MSSLEYRLIDFEKRRRMLKKEGKHRELEELAYRIAYYEQAYQSLKILQAGFNRKILKNAVMDIYEQAQKAREEAIQKQYEQIITAIDAGIENLRSIMQKEFKSLGIPGNVENTLLLCLITLDAIRNLLLKAGQ